MKQAVACILFNEARNQVLLIERRDIPVWVLPGGGIETGEKPEEAALREMLEESGYKVKILRKVAEYQSVNRFTQPTHFFECAIVSGVARPSAESKQVRFFPLNALPKRLPPFYLGWIEDARLAHPGILFKKVEGVSYWVFIKLLLTHPLLVSRFLLTKIGIHINQ
jgi:8-oxo-dGTP pyrophosphatase MutT (NUDIX family)